MPTHFTEQQIFRILSEIEAPGGRLSEVAARHNVLEKTLWRWCIKYGSSDAANAVLPKVADLHDARLARVAVTERLLGIECWRELAGAATRT